MVTEATETPALAVGERFSAAMLARDFAAIEALLAPDVVLNSPISAAFRFEGREDVGAVFRQVRELIDNLAYEPHAGGDRTAILHFRCRIGGQNLEGVDIFRLGPSGEIAEVTVLIRPLAGLTRLQAALGPRIAAERGRWRAVVVRLLTTPLAVITRRSERLGAWLVGRTSH